jgi:probable F420-dependent oxidoreductase
VRIGFHLPQWGADANRDGVITVARAVEEAGLDSVWVADHLVLPTASASSYPYNSETPFGPRDGFLEALTVLSVVAGATERVLLGTSVLVLPMRQPVVTAKVVATLDVLSGGRTVLATGAGWWKEEFEALGAPFDRRGRRFDEQIRVLRALWEKGTTRFDGEFHTFDEIACEPRPVQPGGPPILIGGMGRPAWRRAAELGDGWHAVGVHAETLTEGMAEIARHAESRDRDPGEIALSTSTLLPDDDETALRRLVRLAGVGVSHVVLDTRAGTVSEICQAIDRFATFVLPRLRDAVASAADVPPRSGNSLG